MYAAIVRSTMIIDGFNYVVNTTRINPNYENCDIVKQNGQDMYKLIDFDFAFELRSSP
jgi:hypothetical protein